jgi:hypothetical protein
MANDNQILMYQTEDGETKIEVLYEGQSVWLTQADMAKLFQRNKSVISRHIKNVLDTGELDEKSVVANFATTASDGKTYNVTHYNLDMIISVGYRVNSRRGTQFRIWATQKLRDYIVKGFVMDDKRLAEGQSNYFDELLERIRAIRTSEHNFYDKVKAVFLTSIDYSSQTESAYEFYATVQNKFHYAIHGHTAAELIAERIDSTKDNMGLTNWKGKVLTRQDAQIAKNYLTYNELIRLHFLAEQFLAFAEMRAFEQKPMYMRDWLKKLDGFIKLNDSPLLTHSGKVSRKEMENKVRRELEKYRERLQPEKGFNQTEFLNFLEESITSIHPDSDTTEDSSA